MKPLAQRDFDHLVSLRSLRQFTARRGIWQASAQGKDYAFFHDLTEKFVLQQIVDSEEREQAQSVHELIESDSREGNKRDRQSHGINRIMDAGGI